jgi:hypothetical protein
VRPSIARLEFKTETYCVYFSTRTSCNRILSGLESIYAIISAKSDGFVKLSVGKVSQVFSNIFVFVQL